MSGLTSEEQALIDAGLREISQAATKAADNTARGIVGMRVMYAMNCGHCPSPKVRVGWFRKVPGPKVHTERCEAFRIAISMAEYVVAAFLDQAMFPNSALQRTRVDEALRELEIAVERYCRL